MNEKWICQETVQGATAGFIKRGKQKNDVIQKHEPKTGKGQAMHKQHKLGQARPKMWIVERGQKQKNEQIIKCLDLDSYSDTEHILCNEQGNMRAINTQTNQD